MGNYIQYPVINHNGNETNKQTKGNPILLFKGDSERERKYVCVFSLSPLPRLLL